MEKTGTLPVRRIDPASWRLPKGKARHISECAELQQLPNIGPAMAEDLRQLGIPQPAALAGKEAWALYQRLCQLSGQRQDPCVLDTLMAAVDFARGGPAQPWWAFTAQRKRSFPDL